MLLDAPQLGQSLHDLAFPGYEADVQRIFQELNLIWSAFLRGQVILALIIGAMVTVTMTALGLRSAVIVGLIGATLELIPTVGPTISATIGVGVALFQPSNPFGLSTVWYAVVVLIAYLVIQQIENTVIVPRVIGRSLHLHPLAVLIAAVMGATLAGILGLMLAAPMLATLRLFGRYAYRKFFDLDPWPDPLPVPEKNKPLFRWPFAKKKDVAPLNAPRVDYSYRIFWTKAAREWDADRRRAIAEALAAVMTRPDFEPNDYERRYQVPGLDEPAHSGQSLIALATVLRAFDTKTTDR
ncbi:MAG: AI-2E family transporter [Chloroflexi bacterium]|nr:AI-2E family transporter [Chloroflexota bacterium]